MRIFSIRQVPVTAWSSPKPLNFRPRLPTVFFLCAGLFIFGLGEVFIIAAGIGVSPWTVLAQGVALHAGVTVGKATFVVSIAVLLLWLPLRQVPGVGTIFNAIIVAATIELVLPFVPRPDGYLLQGVVCVSGILLIGCGSGLYLVANLGAGPRDGLMTGLQRLTNLPIAWVRIGIEVAVVASGWLLGGTVGLGTVLFAVLIGPAVSAGLFLTAAATGNQDNSSSF